MIIIEEVLIAEEVVTEQFMCNLQACKGACCWEGDSGAPLEKEELETLKQIHEKVKPFLRPEGREALERQGPYVYFEEAREYGTTLVNNGACAYMTYDGNGVAQCGIEETYNAGLINFKKPLSCHLYPIRIKQNPQSGLAFMEYDRWDICSAACSKGAEEKIPVYRFVKDGLIRKYGEEFYEALEGASAYRKEKR